MATSFFNPTDPFNLSGTGKKWEIQSANDTTSKDRAQALKASGDELASKLYNAKTSYTATYTTTDTDAPVPKFGTIANGYHIDNVQLAWTNTGYVVMTVQGHKHGTATHATCRTYTGSYTTVGTIFGCGTPTSCTAASGAVRSIQWTLTGNHVDELGSLGEFLGAENYDGNETETVECCDDTTLTASTDWDATSTGGNEGNTAAETSTGTFVKHIQADAA